MNHCEPFAALLDPFIDGELTQEETDRVRAHLAQCPDCQAYVADALAMREAFPDIEDVELPAGFTADVMAAVAAHPRKKPASPWRKVLLPLAACFALVVLVRYMPMSGGGAASESTASADTSVAYTADDCATEEIALDTADVAYDTAAEEAAETESLDIAAQNERASLYAVTARLTAADAGDLLAEFGPVQETESALWYELTTAQYNVLLAGLAEKGIVPAEEAPADAGTIPDAVLVIVQK